MIRIREILLRKWLGIPPRFWACCVTLFLSGGVLFFVATVTRFYTVTSTDGTPVTVQAPAAHFGGYDYILNLAHVEAAPDDELQHALLDGGLATLHVERSFPLVLTDGGKPTEHKIVKGTVAEVLQRLGVTLGEEDYTEPALTEPVTRATGEIAVHRVTYRDYTIDEVVPYETQYEYTSLFYRNQSRQMLIQQGQNGYYKASLQDKLIDGEVVETTTVSVENDVKPVPHILKVYQAGAPVSKIEAPEGITIENGVPSSYSAVYSMKATGYYSPRGKGASGLGLYYGTFAVDPSLIPYGKKVYIVSENGKFVYGWAIPTDTGMFIHSNRMQVDLFYETYQESAINGVQQVLVYIV